jgi:hypothetical protein
MLIANIANKTCPFSTVVGMNTHIQQQVNNISGTPELDINYSMGGEGGPFQEILISIDSKLKHGIHL